MRRMDLHAAPPGLLHSLSSIDKPAGDIKPLSEVRHLARGDRPEGALDSPRNEASPDARPPNCGA
jgi:hypothetical protein